MTTMTIRTIQSHVARYYQVTLADLVGQRRYMPLVHHRHLAMYLARLLTSASFPVIGRAFQGRDHSTVIHACTQVGERIGKDCTLASAAEAIVLSLSAQGEWTTCAPPDPVTKLLQAIEKTDPDEPSDPETFSSPPVLRCAGEEVCSLRTMTAATVAPVPSAYTGWN